MDTDVFRIPKKLQPVSLWVHPEGSVVGSIYLHLQSNTGSGEEQPLEVMNHPDPFLVLKCENPEGLRFYNKRSVVRVQYQQSEVDDAADIIKLPCRLHMMDGSLLRGTIKERLPPEHRRLFDYINIHEDKFVKLHVEEDRVLVVNKAYIVRITPAADADGTSS
ncbi:MAG: hypothetical protein ACR2RB_08145 [Gammaproteobacteria bacterium]